ncbi:MAG: hypothetical protein KF724_03475 [Phycisphaeraceae bacterium]|nr:hypothetical protein [Phycisphaeraceae bacterium]
MKLAHALDTFGPAGSLGSRGLDVRGLRCADFGCNKGGFTDCLLQRGAAHVIAIDTGYNIIDWKLRSDRRVEVRERTNALHAEPPREGVDLVVIDLSWTPQRLAVPAALRWLSPSGAKRIITLVKPHYELRADEKHLLERGFLAHDRARGVAERVASEMPALGASVIDSCASPIMGGKSSRARKGEGNLEFLMLIEPARSG